MNKKISLKEAIKFHGHLGPYLVLGLLAGEVALKKLSCKKYFGIEVKVFGATKKPKSCFIDGLQLSTGATYGKGNIFKFNGPAIKVEFKNLKKQSKLLLKFSNDLVKKLGVIKSHQDSELLASELYKTRVSRIFNLQLTA